LFCSSALSFSACRIASSLARLSGDRLGGIAAHGARRRGRERGWSCRVSPSRRDTSSMHLPCVRHAPAAHLRWHAPEHAASMPDASTLTAAAQFPARTFTRVVALSSQLALDELARGGAQHDDIPLLHKPRHLQRKRRSRSAWVSELFVGRRNVSSGAKSKDADDAVTTTTHA
jgi:hypothetical protein